MRTTINLHDRRRRTFNDLSRTFDSIEDQHEAGKDISEDRVDQRPHQAQEVPKKWHDTNNHKTEGYSEHHGANPNGPVLRSILLEVSGAAQNPDESVLGGDVAVKEGRYQKTGEGDAVRHFLYQKPCWPQRGTRQVLADLAVYDGCNGKTGHDDETLSAD